MDRSPTLVSLVVGLLVITDDDVPAGLLAQIAYPFRKHRLPSYKWKGGAEATS